MKNMTVIDIRLLEPAILKAERIVIEDLRVLGSAYAADPSGADSMARYARDIEHAGTEERHALEGLWAWIKRIRENNESALQSYYSQIAKQWVQHVPELGDSPPAELARAVQRTFSTIAMAFQSSQPLTEEGVDSEPQTKLHMLELDLAKARVSWVGTDESFSLRTMARNAASDSKVFRDQTEVIGQLVERELRNGRLPGFDTELEGDVLRAVPRLGVVEPTKPTAYENSAVSVDPKESELLLPASGGIRTV